MAEGEQQSRSGLVATSGIWDGLHPGMGLAAKGMIVAFVVFTALEHLEEKLNRGIPNAADT
jgi:dipeptide/tripeptide permease